MQTLYHVTTADKAAAILQDGFQDGVRLSERPREAGDGASGEGPSRDGRCGDTVLAVSFGVPLWALTDFEIIEAGRSCREWCLPADLVDCHAEIRVADQAALAAGASRQRHPHA